MKFSTFSALFFVIGSSLVFVTFSNPIDGAFRFPIFFATNCTCGERRTVISIGRKLKENERDMRSHYEGDIGSVTLNDYSPNNPIPDAKNYVKGGTIEHNQPIGPYKPKPMPPPPGDGDES